MVKKMSSLALAIASLLVLSFPLIAQSASPSCTPDFGAMHNESFTVNAAYSALVDFDDDGKTDVITVNENGVPSIRFRTAEGFSAPVVSDYMQGMFHPKAITIGYFDGDFIEGEFVVNPYPDIAVATTEGGIYLLTSDPYGYFSFRGTPVMDGQFAAIAAVDFNEDGMSDLMAVDVTGVGVTRLSQADGNWGEFAISSYTSLAFAEGEAPVSAAAGYFDGELSEGSFLMNDSPDLAVLTNQGRVLLFTTDPYGYFSVRELSMGSAVAELRTADFNQDGRTDLLTKDAAGMVSMMRRNVNGDFDAPHAIGETPVASLIDAADLNGDGSLDIAVTMGEDAHFAWIGSEATCEPTS